MSGEVAIRAATPADAAALAELVNIAGEGIPLHVWTGMAEPGEDVWEVGRRRAARDEGSFSWRIATVAEVDGVVVSAMVGYPLDDAPEPADLSSLPPMFRPMQELEELAPGTWYVNVVATYESHRGQGIGARLLEVARQKAVAAGKRGLSIVVQDANPARRLYERAGYREIARRRIVEEGGWTSPGTDWVLLVADL